MLECKNCGAALHYDIKAGDLACSQCGSHFPVGELSGERVARPETPDTENPAAQTDDAYECTIFTCPQCGGEIISFQNEATEFCSYCGASVTLEGRLSSTKQPDTIVPFKITKEDCLTRYLDHLKGLPFVPSEMMNETAQEKLCGIYMPFWLYDVRQKGNYLLKGTRRSGDKMQYCNINTQLDTEYTDICYDASSSFDDTLAQSVAPFSFYEKRPFDPGYLCGFYTDTADVDSLVYRQKAIDEASDRTFDTICKADSTLKDITISEADSGRIFGEISDTRRALLPVWFLTWRSGNRVAYSVVNGTNGKVSADVPVDEKKYLLFSLAIGLIAAFALYSLFPVILRTTAVRLTYILACAALFLYYQTFREKVERELHLYDPGFTGETASYINSAKQATERKYLRRRIIALVFCAVFIILCFSAYHEDLFYALISLAGLLVRHMDIVIFCLALFLECWVHVRMFDDHQILPDRRALLDTLLLIPAALLSIAVLIIHPVSDLWYYLVCVVTGLCMLNMLLGMIREYNILATRAIPQFHNRKRGDGNA